MLLDQLTPDQQFRLGQAVGQNPLVSALFRRAMDESMTAQEFAVVLAEHTVRAMDASAHIAFEMAKDRVRTFTQPCLN